MTKIAIDIIGTRCYTCTMKRLNIRISDEDHRELRVASAMQGMTIIAAVNEAIKDWVRRFEDKRKGIDNVQHR